jgi:type II secretory pathway component PulF
MTIGTDALATSSAAVIALVGTLSTYIFALLAVTLGLAIGLWFLYKAFGKAKGAVR